MTASSRASPSSSFSGVVASDSRTRPAPFRPNVSPGATETFCSAVNPPVGAVHVIESGAVLEIGMGAPPSGSLGDVTGT